MGEPLKRFEEVAREAAEELLSDPAEKKDDEGVSAFIKRNRHNSIVLNNDQSNRIRAAAKQALGAEDPAGKAAKLYDARIKIPRLRQEFIDAVVRDAEKNFAKKNNGDRKQPPAVKDPQPKQENSRQRNARKWRERQVQRLRRIKDGYDAEPTIGMNPDDWEMKQESQKRARSNAQPQTPAQPSVSASDSMSTMAGEAPSGNGNSQTEKLREAIARAEAKDGGVDYVDKEYFRLLSEGEILKASKHRKELAKRKHKSDVLKASDDEKHLHGGAAGTHVEHRLRKISEIRKERNKDRPVGTVSEDDSDAEGNNDDTETPENDEFQREWQSIIDRVTAIENRQREERFSEDFKRNLKERLEDKGREGDFYEVLQYLDEYSEALSNTADGDAFAEAQQAFGEAVGDPWLAHDIYSDYVADKERKAQRNAAAASEPQAPVQQQAPHLVPPAEGAVRTQGGWFIPDQVQPQVPAGAETIEPPGQAPAGAHLDAAGAAQAEGAEGGPISIVDFLRKEGQTSTFKRVLGAIGVIGLGVGVATFAAAPAAAALGISALLGKTAAGAVIGMMTGAVTGSIRSAFSADKADRLLKQRQAEGRHLNTQLESKWKHIGKQAAWGAGFGTLGGAIGGYFGESIKSYASSGGEWLSDAWQNFNGVTDMRADMSTLTGHVSAIEASAQGLESKFGTFLQQWQGLDLGTRLDGVEGTLRELVVQAQANGQSLAEISANVEALPAEVRQLIADYPTVINNYFLADIDVWGVLDEATPPLVEVPVPDVPVPPVGDLVISAKNPWDAMGMLVGTAETLDASEQLWLQDAFEDYVQDGASRGYSASSYLVPDLLERITGIEGARSGSLPSDVTFDMNALLKDEGITNDVLSRIQRDTGLNDVSKEKLTDALGTLIEKAHG